MKVCKHTKHTNVLERIKKFFNDLDNLGILENTVVVVMGDHLAFRDLFGSLNKIENRNLYFKIYSNKKFKDQK